MNTWMLVAIGVGMAVLVLCYAAAVALARTEAVVQAQHACLEAALRLVHATRHGDAGEIERATAELRALEAQLSALQRHT